MVVRPQSVVSPKQLELDRCPHCKVDTPNLERFDVALTHDSLGIQRREWGFYHCRRCGGVVSAAWSLPDSGRSELLAIYPDDDMLDASIDDVAKEYLKQ